jgi:hypothetical protein
MTNPQSPSTKTHFIISLYDGKQKIAEWNRDINGGKLLSNYPIMLVDSDSNSLLHSVELVTFYQQSPSHQ